MSTQLTLAVHVQLPREGIRTVVITSNAPNPRVRTHAHACTRACKQLTRIIGCYSQLFLSCQVVRVRFLIDFCS